MDYKKSHSVAKIVEVRGERLNRKILDTMKLISDVVGATLGPGGMPVLIERQEYGFPALVTKDGVTVFRALGFHDPIAHSIMESAREGAVRTVTEAGDGTSTATVLAEAIVRLTLQFCTKYPNRSSQEVIRNLKTAFNDIVAPAIRASAIGADISTDEGRAILKSVAKISGNGDAELAEAVIKCFDLVGDDGNVTISELSGGWGYEVEKIEGFPVGIGYEDTCGKFMTAFINDTATQSCRVQKPHYAIHNGPINDLASVLSFFGKCFSARQQGLDLGQNYVLVASGFSEFVLSALAMTFADNTDPKVLRIVPLVAPKSIIQNGEYHWMLDLAAITGATVMEDINNKMEKADPMDVLGRSDVFEMYRYRSVVVGHNDSEEVLDRAALLRAQVAETESTLDRNILEERIGKITGGIARLKVIGATNGELREKKDRAEDAVCAVKGAIKFGALPGGGWMLIKLSKLLAEQQGAPPEIKEIFAAAMLVPVYKLLTNIGILPDDCDAIVWKLEADITKGKTTVFDALKGEYVDAVSGGVLDSVPAVVEAIRNSLSIASLHGSLGAVVVYERDDEYERAEARDTQDYVRNANFNPADEHA